MKTILSLSALLITLTLTAQSNTATWYLNDTSGNGIQSPTSVASGDYSTAVGYSTTASNFYSTAMGENSVASGWNSTAMGRNTVASGSSTTAMGINTTASGGSGSTAMGSETTASGVTSFSMGYQSTASGWYSTTIGVNSIASDNNSFVIGRYNLLGSTVTNNATQFRTGNTAFVIGNGADADNRSDALTVLFDGTTNVAGSVTATAFIGDGSQLTNLSVSSLFSLNDESGTGGIETFGSIASGNSSRALGCCQTTASGDFSTALGGSTLASGSGSTTMGYYTEASGDYSTAMGYSTTASGQYATAIGFRATASDKSSLVVGQYNLLGSTVTNSATDFSADNTAFVIGNGADSDNRSDALTILFDGTTNVAGSVTATAFIGDGSQLTNLTSNSPFSYNTNNEGGIEIADYTTASGSRAFAVGNDNLASGSSSTAMGRGTIASGDDSTALGANTEASGRASTALGANTTASGDFSTTIGRNSIASGTNSFAIGYGASEEYDPELSSPYYKNEALGSDSFVIGRRNKSSGGKSFSVGNDNLTSGLGAGSIGENNIASGDYSYSIGLFNQSIGSKSIAIGNNSYADGYATTAIGSANTIDNNAQNEWSLNNRAFVIGNGVYDESTQQINRSDALTVLFDGTTNVAGSVTATEFIGDGSQLTNLSVSSPFSLNDTSGNGIQSETNIASGDYSMSTGYENIASGDYSTAMGRGTTASGLYSTAMGYNTTASGGGSFAIGGTTTASGGGSFASGTGSTASGTNSVAMGDNSTASGSYSFAHSGTASGTGSIAMVSATASGEYSTAISFSTIASGNHSTAMGRNTTASDYNSFVIGRYNLLGSTVTNSATEFNSSSPAFVIGNGYTNAPFVDDGRSDALTVLFDGTTTIAGDLNLNSDARLKANIISLGSTLAKLLQIDGKTYTMKKDENKKQKIGVLAQDIEKVFPELVSESNGIKSVNYQGLVPVLINALKEQDSKMNEQENKMNEQEARIERLEKLLLNI